MQRLIYLTLIVCLLLDSLIGLETFAQKPPYDNPPAVAAPYFRVRYEASEIPGQLIFPVAYTIWIPPKVEKLRGVIVHQHGCGEGSCKSGQSGAFDLHWQALARQHQCALLAPSYEQPQGANCQMWCDPRNGSAETFTQALVDLGKLAGHPELNEVPWALWGHSGGGHWAGGMLMLYPERIIAVWLRSGVPLFEAVEGRNITPHALPKEALKVPVMCNLGTKEGVSDKNGRFAGVWPSNQTFFHRMRSAGGLVGVAIDPLTSHECGNQRYLAIPWFDACLRRRLPAQRGAAIKDLNPREGWLTPLVTDASGVVQPVPAAEFKGDLKTSLWLPDRQVAFDWMQYVTDTEVTDATLPPAPTSVAVEDGHLVWAAEADLQSGIAYFLVERDGVEIAKVPGKATNPFGRTLFQGLQYSDTPTVPLVEMRFRLDENHPSEAIRYAVRTVNTVGGRSAAAKAKPTEN